MSSFKSKVPEAQLETWLVHRDPDPLIGGFPAPPHLMEGTVGAIERPQNESTMEQGAVLDSLEEDEEETTDLDRSGYWECQSFDSKPVVPSNMLPENLPMALDLEHQWQDLMDILEPESTNFEMMTSLSHIPDSRTPATAQGEGSEAPPQNSNNLGNAGTAAYQTFPLTGDFLHYDLLGTPNQLEQEPLLLPLTPSDELDEHSSIPNTVVTLENSRMDSWTINSNHTDLLAENPIEDIDKGMSAEDNLATVSMNLLTQDVTPFGYDFHSYDIQIPVLSQACKGNDLNQGFGVTSSNSFVLTEEEAGGLSSQMNDILEDFNLLEDIPLLNKALEEEVSPEMEVGIEEEGYLHCEGVHQEIDTSGNWMRDRQQPNGQEDGRMKTDSDFRLLSTDFIYSPYSFVSEGSSADDSSSCVSAVENQFFEEVDSSDEEGSGLEVEVTIKQEEVADEEMGAVGGHSIPLFSANHDNKKQFHCSSWLEHVWHDHTYNIQHLSSMSSPAQGRMYSKQTTCAARHDKARPHHCSSSRPESDTKNWNRDEQRARTLKIPFSYELVVNLPVEEFNDLLTSYRLTKKQLTLIKDIRRRGKNKLAAQNCRKRKQDMLLALENDMKALRCHHSQLLQEKQSSLRHLQDMKSRFGTLYQEIFSKLIDDNGRPLDATEYKLCFGPNDTEIVASPRARKNSKKQRGLNKRRS